MTGDPTFTRPSREDMFFEMAHALRKRSSCLRGKVGAVVVREKRIVAMGYNGAPPDMPHCYDLGCNVLENNHEAGCQRAIHAEANAIAFAARYGVAIDECAMYCTHGPCLKCAQLIVASGIIAVHYQTPYRLSAGLELLDQANVPAVHHEH